MCNYIINKNKNKNLFKHSQNNQQQMFWKPYIDKFRSNVEVSTKSKCGGSATSGFLKNGNDYHTPKSGNHVGSCGSKKDAKRMYLCPGCRQADPNPQIRWNEPEKKISGFTSFF
jgi:hypothetical protein